MDFLAALIASVLQSCIPTEYMGLVVAVLVFLLALEQWLASTNRIKANSTLQLISGIAQSVINRNKPKPPDAPADPTGSVTKQNNDGG